MNKNTGQQNHSSSADSSGTAYWVPSSRDGFFLFLLNQPMWTLVLSIVAWITSRFGRLADSLTEISYPPQRAVVGLAVEGRHSVTSIGDGDIVPFRQTHGRSAVRCR